VRFGEPFGLPLPLLVKFSSCILFMLSDSYWVIGGDSYYQLRVNVDMLTCFFMEGIMKTIVNTDVKMSKHMMNCLGLFQAHCAWTKVKEVTEDQVKEFLLDRFDQQTADQFKAEYLYQ